MEAKTTFRKTLIEHLCQIISDGRMDDFQHQYPFIEAKFESAIHWVSYYDDVLMNYDGFKAEFLATETTSILDFSVFLKRCLDSEARKVNDWHLVQKKAKLLLETLMKGQA